MRLNLWMHQNIRMDQPLQFGHLAGDAALQSARLLEVRDPGLTTDLVGLIGDATPDQVAQCCEAAHQALPVWRATPVAERASVLTQLAQRLDDSAEYLATLLIREQGMLSPVTRTELRLAAEEVRNIIDRGVPFLQDETHAGPASHTLIRKRPFGVVAGIVPWNAPIILTLSMLAPAVLAGNTVVIKPSELAPLGVNWLLRRVADLFPAGVINLVNGGVEAARALVDDPRVRKVSFTGGGSTARHVMAACARSLKDVQLELGGNDPAIVLDDAPLERTVSELAQAAFRRSGQYCFAVKRIYVSEALHDRFLEAFCEQVDRIQVGHGSDSRSTMGPVINQAKVAHVQALAAQASHAGARVFELGSLLESGRGPGHYLRPRVVADVPADADIVRQEQFGPIIPILRYRDLDDAVAQANDTDFGLCGSVWSADRQAAAQVAARIESGRVYLNAHRPTDLGHRHMPFGGLKQSGIGWSNGSHGVAAFVQFHSVDGVL